LGKQLFSNEIPSSRVSEKIGGHHLDRVPLKGEQKRRMDGIVAFVREALRTVNDPFDFPPCRLHPFFAMLFSAGKLC
jgi:hypothetical protein